MLGVASPSVGGVPAGRAVAKGTKPTSTRKAKAKKDSSSTFANMFADGVYGREATLSVLKLPVYVRQGSVVSVRAQEVTHLSSRTLKVVVWVRRPVAYKEHRLHYLLIK